jgi:hypothetical protein
MEMWCLVCVCCNREKARPALNPATVGEVDVLAKEKKKAQKALKA